MVVNNSLQEVNRLQELGYAGEEGNLASRRKVWSQDMRSSRETRAKRLKALRSMTCLSRRAFYEKYNIPTGTLQNWESARFGGLSEKGAYIILQALKAEGIDCSFEWLMCGIGAGPRLSKSKFGSNQSEALKNKAGLPLENQEASSVNSEALESMLAIISQELMTFRNLNADPVDIVITDDSMMPRFIQGEYVAGSRLYGADIEKAIGEICIVETAQGDTLVRKVRRGNRPDLYRLLCTNLDSNVERPSLYDVELVYAAPIVWVRRVGRV